MASERFLVCRVYLHDAMNIHLRTSPFSAVATWQVTGTSEDILARPVASWLQPSLPGAGLAFLTTCHARGPVGCRACFCLSIYPCLIS